MKIAVLTHNPKGKWGDVRPQIEQGFYEKWGKGGISLKLGQQVLIYISKGFNKIKYIMEVSNVYDDSVDLKLIQELDERKSELLSFEKLKDNGLKIGTVNYILDNNQSLFKYVHSVLNNIITKTKNSIKTKNIILYGAPGVGKTHNYQRIISMIEEGKSEKDIFDVITDNKSSLHVKINEEAFQQIKDEKRVEFVTFHQSYSYEDFIEGFRPSDNGSIELEDGIFKNISSKAENNLTSSYKDFKVDFKSILNQFQLKFEIGSKFKTYNKSNEFIISKYTDKSIHIQVNDNKFSISYLPLEELYYSNKIKPINNPQAVVDALSGRFKGLATYYYPIFKEMLLFNEIKQEITDLKNFYIVIDEINRGNISKIFGELITLIEEDKRDKYEVTLPYSKEPFKIPSNLYIIATMNSTDKSIATIDIALRRRFTFLKMKPNLELVENIEAKELMKKLNKYIEENLSEDYMLGHSYFMGQNIDLEFIKEYKIKPLLEEYFYADEDKLKEVLHMLNSLHIESLKTF